MLAKSSLYQNSYGYQAGSQLLAGVNVSSGLWTKDWWFMLGTLVYNEQPERWSGVTESEGNLGRTDLLLETSISWRFHNQWNATLAAKFPVYSHAVGAQLNTPAIVELGLSRSFELIRK